MHAALAVIARARRREVAYERCVGAPRAALALARAAGEPVALRAARARYWRAYRAA